MLGFIVYLLPALIDLVAGQLFFIYPNLLAHQGQKDLVISAVISSWGICYSVVSYAVGRFVTQDNAARIVTRACWALAILCVGMSLSSRPVWVLPCCGMFGALAGFFFPPFQVFMKQVQGLRAKSVIGAVGLYTFAWSTGIALGPLIAGFLMKNLKQGWRLCFWLDACFCLVCVAGIRFAQRHITNTQPASAPVSSQAVTTGAVLPDLAWLGWLGSGVGLLALTFIRTLFPAMSVKSLNMGEDIQGIVFFLMCFCQGLSGLALSYSGRLMYRPLGPLIFGGLGIAGALCFMLGRSPLVFYIGSIGFGIYAGFIFFYLVFHAIVHPTKSSRYIAVNESVVGLTGIIGAPIAGALSDATHTYLVPFGATVVIVLAVVLFQAVIHSRHPVSSEDMKAARIGQDV